MAVAEKVLATRLRLTGADEKTAATYTGLDASVSPNSVNLFTLAVAALTVKPIRFQYLVIDSELVEEPDGDE